MTIFIPEFLDIGIHDADRLVGLEDANSLLQIEGVYPVVGVYEADEISR